MSTEEVYTVGFVSFYLLPNNRPNALDPFLEPLVADLENSFIEGKYILHTQSARKYRKNPNNNRLQKIHSPSWSSQENNLVKTNFSHETYIVGSKRIKLEGWAGLEQRF